MYTHYSGIICHEVLAHANIDHDKMGITIINRLYRDTFVLMQTSLIHHNSLVLPSTLFQFINVILATFTP